MTGLVALINAVRLLPDTRGSDRQRVVLCILLGAVFGLGPLALVASAFQAARLLIGG